MELKIWHNSNFGRGDQFERAVPDVETAKVWLNILADYDLYQGDKVIANAQGLMAFNELSGQWDEWENEDGENISDVLHQEADARPEPVKDKVLHISREKLSRRKQRR